MKILVLAGGFDQIALIHELNCRGHQTVLVDYFENPPAKDVVNKHIVASTLDVEKVESIAKSEKVDLICTACTDQALLTVAYVSERLGLPCYISYQVGLNVTNKSYMKKVLSHNNIPTSKYSVVNRANLNAIKDFVFPLVVKPVDCNSSKGVMRVDNNNEYIEYVKQAIYLSRTQTAIVEEFKEGKEISADFYIDNGTVKLLSATSSLKIRDKNSFAICCSEYPAVNSSQERKLIEIASQIAKSFSLDNTPLLVQLIAGHDEMSVIEFSARMGGGSKYKLIEVLSGVDIMSVYVDRILGGHPTVNPTKKVDYCKLVYIYCQPGIFNHVEGFVEMKASKMIDDYFVYKTPGMEICDSKTSGDRPAGYLCTAYSEHELRNKIEYVDSHLKVISEEGNDIMIHHLIY